MKKLLKKAVAAVLAASMLTSVGSVAAFAQTDDGDNGDNYYKGVFYYRPGFGEIAPLTDSIDYYTYSDSYFKGDSRVYNDHLATLSMSLGEASVSSNREPYTIEGYKNKSRDVTAFLEDTGFSEIKINQYYTEKPSKDSIGIVCAHKKINDGGKDYTLLAIVPRSAGYEAEWGNNFVLGESGDAAGFEGSAEKILAYTKDYVAEKGISGNIKVWTVGYSRGAAITNIIAKKLIDAPKESIGEAVELSADNLYAYTFGTPSAADINNDPHNERYAGIFNSFANTEIASAMAPIDMGFERYGTDNMFLNKDDEDKMFVNLKICNPDIYQMFLDGSGSNSFSPKKLGIKDGSIGLVNDEKSYIPNDPKEFLSGLCAYLTQVSGGRENFAKVYEQPFSDLLAYYESLTGDDSAAFTSAIGSHEDTLSLVVSMYAYFMKYKMHSEIKATIDEAVNKVKELAEVAASADGDNDTGIGVDDITKAGAQLIKFLLMKPEKLQPIAAGYLGNVIGDAMKASGATDEQINNICNEESLNALTHLLSHLLLGNVWQSSAVKPLSIDNEQIKNAATLIGNFSNIMTDHVNEVIISWLRLSDTYFSDYAPLTEAQSTGYRRVYFGADTAKLNGDITGGDGEVVATIENGELKNVTDKWVGFTSTDEGGFYRIPLSDTYKFNLNNVSGKLTAKVGEYDCYTANTSFVFEQTVYTESEKNAVLTLPAIITDKEVEDEYSFTLDEVEGKYLIGDIDMNGTVNIFDVTALQKAIASGNKFSELFTIIADADGNGKVSIQDVTEIQFYLADVDNRGNRIGELVIYHS